MLISKELQSQYIKFDPEVSLFFNFFDEESNLKILEIGAHDNAAAQILAISGHDVTGVDLRETDQVSHKNYKHIVGDFCNMPIKFYKKQYGTYDCVITISAIEHFGLGVYGDESDKEYYDVVAMNHAYNMLKPGGRCYIVVPFGGKFITVKPHWRVYDFGAIKDRLQQNFKFSHAQIQCSEKVAVHGTWYEPNTPMDLNTAIFNTSGFPGISAFVKLIK